jgi:hypothetical protein
VFESVQGVHAFAGTPSSFFIPTFSTSLWLFTVEKLLSQLRHVIAGSDAVKISCAKMKLVARTV